MYVGRGFFAEKVAKEPRIRGQESGAKNQNLRL